MKRSLLFLSYLHYESGMSMRRLYLSSVVFALLFLFGHSVSFGANVKFYWEPWQRLPVYDNGRAMPLNTYAKLIVKEICGTSQPHLYRDDLLLGELERGSPEITGIANPSEEDMIRFGDISARIKEYIPDRGRYFEAHELLFSWMIEPEIWRYIPVLQLSDHNYRTDVLRLEPFEKLQHVAPGQIINSERFYECKETIVNNEKTLGAEGKEYKHTKNDETTILLSKSLSLFLDVVFDPREDAAPREKYDPEFHSARMGYTDHRFERYKRYFDAWEALEQSYSETLKYWQEVLGSVDSNRRTDTQDDPQTKFSFALMNIRILIRNMSMEDANPDNRFDPELAEERFEFMLNELEKAIEKIDALLAIAYTGAENPGIPSRETTEFVAIFDPDKLVDNRLNVFRLRYSLRNLRKSTNMAYRAMYDNGRTVRVLPALHDEPIRADRDSSDVSSPWLSFRTLQSGGDAMLYRFADRVDTLPSTPPEIQNIRGARENSIDPQVAALLDSHDSSKMYEDGILALRVTIRELKKTYQAFDSTNFELAIDRLAIQLRAIGERNEKVRESLLPEELRDEEIIAKTAYPSIGAMGVEFRYAEIDPFFKMWLGSIGSIVFTLLAVVIGIVRKILLARKQDENVESDYAYASGTSYSGVASSTMAAEIGSNSGRRKGSITDLLRWIECFFCAIGIVLLLFSAIISGSGMLMRSMISGWAPITNMFESVILLAFLAAALGVYMTMQPLIWPLCYRAWVLSGFPIKFKKTSHENEDNTENSGAATKKGFSDLKWQQIFCVPRIILMVVTFWFVMRLCFSDPGEKIGLIEACTRLFSTPDMVDLAAVLGTVVALSWFCPRLIFSVFAVPIALFSSDELLKLSGIDPAELEREAESETAVQQPQMYGPQRGELQVMMESAIEGNAKSKRNSFLFEWFLAVSGRIVDRKVILICCSIIVFLACLATISNESHFNPQIKPIMAVLRSNFWLVVHVTAIIASYAVGFIAWLFALVMMGGYLFGTYRHEKDKKGRIVQTEIPKVCEWLAPYVLRLLQTATILLAAGTILGGRWADYSWGRFWGWDPKEVWALITLFVYLITLHGYRAKMYGKIGLAFGSIVGAISVIITWYGFNFVFSVGRHAYGGGSGDLAQHFIVRLAGIVAFLMFSWAMAGIIRYQYEKYRT